MTSNQNLISLQLKTSDNFNKNLNRLIKHIKKTDGNSVILAPELYLTGYAYDRFDEAYNITKKAIKELSKLSKNKIIALTLITKKKKQFYNTLHIFYQGKIVHTQSKYHLFVLNDEKKYFSQGDIEDIKIVNIGGIKIAAMICFELRFIDLWKKTQGADLILIPAMWGKPRKTHFEALTKSLAIVNQSYLIASNSSNTDMAKSSCIVSPFGDVTSDDNSKVILSSLDPKQIKKMRRYMQVGIK